MVSFLAQLATSKNKAVKSEEVNVNVKDEPTDDEGDETKSQQPPQKKQR